MKLKEKHILPITKQKGFSLIPPIIVLKIKNAIKDINKLMLGFTMYLNKLVINLIYCIDKKLI